MAHYPPRDGSTRSRFPSLDSLASAPFDDTMSHLHALHHNQHLLHHNQHLLHHQQALLHHQQAARLHQQSLPSPHHAPSSHHPSLPAAHHPHHPSPADIHQIHRNMQQAHHAMLEMHEQVAAMHNMMFQQAEHLINNMMTLTSNLPPIAQLTHPEMLHRHQSSGFTHFPPLSSRGHSQPEFSYESMLQLDEAVARRGVSPSDLARLKRARYSMRDICKQCGICQDNFVVGTKVIVLPCLHSYCEPEILKWFEQNKTCPTCRRVVENLGPY